MASYQHEVANIQHRPTKRESGIFLNSRCTQKTKKIEEYQLPRQYLVEVIRPAGCHLILDPNRATIAVMVLLMSSFSLN